METYQLRRGAYKNLTLRLTAEGSLRVSAPWFLPRFAIEAFIEQKASWITAQRETLARRLPVEGVLNSVRLWGRHLPLRIESPERRPRVVVDDDAVVLRVPVEFTDTQRRKTIRDWQKRTVGEALEQQIPDWSARMGLEVRGWRVKHLRSRWGSCRPDTKTLVFNALLAELPRECLEHVVVHEMVHLIEASHNARFHSLVEQWLPGSARVRTLLKKGSVTAESDVSATHPARPSGEKVP